MHPSTSALDVHRQVTALVATAVSPAPAGQRQARTDALPPFVAPRVYWSSLGELLPRVLREVGGMSRTAGRR